MEGAPEDRKTLRQRAVRLLARREHSRAELAAKLARYGNQDDIEQVIAELVQDGMQSDARVAESFVRASGARLGSARLRQTLRRKGVATELIESELASGGLEDEAARARAIWAKKFGAPPTDAREWARQARFLQARGFTSEVIRRLLKSLPEGGDE